MVACITQQQAETLACSFPLVLPLNQGSWYKKARQPQWNATEMATLSSSRTKFLQLLICCGGRAGISSVAAGLRLATTPKVIATKSKVLLCRASSQVSMPAPHCL